jgi:hypothetical protein
MFNKSAALFTGFLFLTACAASQPHVIRAAADSPDITITVGMATQIEMPDQGRVSSVVVGNKDLVIAEQQGDVVTLSAKDGAGETNLIIRSRDDGGNVKVYQYHITVRKP